MSYHTDREWHPKYEWVLGLGVVPKPKPKTQNPLIFGF